MLHTKPSSLDIVSLIEDLRKTTKRTEKIALLEQYKDDTFIQDVFVFTYDKARYNYYITDVEECTNDGNCDIVYFIERLYKLYTRELTGNKAREYLQEGYRNLRLVYKDVARCIINRDLKCGVTTTTINKIWPNLIYVPPYMRCSSFSLKNMQNVKYPAYSQIKADGLYCNIIVTNEGNVRYESRNGNELKFRLPDFVEKQLTPNTVYMGEALAKDLETKSIMSREDGNGYLNSDNVDSNRVYVLLWDMLDLNEFREGKSNRPYSERLNKLKLHIKFIQAGPSIMHVIPTKEVKNVDEVIEHFKQASNNGLEGTVVKNMNAKFKNGTSKDQIKFKCEFDVDLKIVDIQLGKGKNKGILGALVCESSDGKLKVNLGTGLTDRDRIDFKKRFFVGDIVTAKANSVIESNSKDTFSLFLPRYVEVRRDKTEADTLERIIEQEKSFLDALKFK